MLDVRRLSGAFAMLSDAPRCIDPTSEVTVLDQTNSTQQFLVKVSWNEYGTPVTDTPEHARVSVAVDPGGTASDGVESLRGVFINGNVEGLRWLASQILAVAETKLDGYHTHLDSEAFSPVYRSYGGWSLTIGRTTGRR